MTTKDFTLSLLTDQSPEKVFQSVNNVRKWWSGYYSEEIIGDTEKLNDEFSFSAGEGVHFTRHKLVEVIPNKKVVWLTIESKLNFIQKQDEWTGSKVIFEISQIGNKTKLVFTHEGLKPEAECYEACAPAWTQYLQGKLLPLIDADND